MADRILVADDGGDVTSMLAFNLDRAGFSVATAGDGSEAFEKARMFLPDAVVLDVQMPKLDGFAVCRMLRQTPATRNIPVLLIAGKANERGRAESERCGAAEYLTKPFSSGELVRRVHAALEHEREHDLDD